MGAFYSSTACSTSTADTSSNYISGNFIKITTTASSTTSWYYTTYQSATTNTIAYTPPEPDLRLDKKFGAMSRDLGHGPSVPERSHSAWRLPDRLPTLSKKQDQPASFSRDLEI